MWKCPSADEAEAHRAVDPGRARHRGYEAAAGVGEVRILHALGRAGTEADDAVFGLEEHVDILRQVMGNQVWAARCRG